MGFWGYFTPTSGVKWAPTYTLQGMNPYPTEAEVWKTGKCLTPTQLLICSSFSRENGHLLLICSSLSTSENHQLKSAVYGRGYVIVPRRVTGVPAAHGRVQGAIGLIEHRRPSPWHTWHIGSLLVMYETWSKEMSRFSGAVCCF